MKAPRSIKLKSQLIKVFWITLAWTSICVYHFLISYGAVLQFNGDFGNLSPAFILRGSILTGIMAGILGGGFLVFAWEKWLRNKTYGIALRDIFLSFCLLYILVAAVNSISFQMNNLGISFFDKALVGAVIGQIMSVGEIQSFLFWIVIVLGTLIVLQVNDKYGPGVFKAFLMGRYFQPKKEERIFMFLDLRSSTTIAEKLGEERYFHFIKTVFRDITPAIIYSKGEIYQYVGDEVVVSWKMQNGLEDANCIQCFFDVQSVLLQESAYYIENFDGIKPEFKAGLHYGHAMVGEVGVVKRDIAFSGDVLNTTARIQSKCNKLGVNILISKYLLDKIGPLPNPFKSVEIGEIQLRGKQNTVKLYTAL
jgi:adenylate cyclase